MHSGMASIEAGNVGALSKTKYGIQRWLKVGLTPFVVVVAFSILLLSLGLLSTQTTSPARSRNIGWQSWDIVKYHLSSESAQQPSSVQDDDEWATASSALPLEKWDPLVPHTTGITEITVVSCWYPPWIYPQLCAPATTGEEDKLKGKWVRVERDLNLKRGMWYLNVHYRRTRRLDAPLITDILFLQDGQTPPDGINLSEYTKAQGNWNDGVWPKRPILNAWYKTRAPNQPGLSIEELHTRTAPSVNTLDSEIITELDVLYGDGPPFWGFQRSTNGPISPTEGEQRDAVDLVMRKGRPVAPLAHPQKFSQDGKFKILQIADLHFSVSHGKCRDVGPDHPDCIGDDDTLTLMNTVLDAERPDMVVFTGDQLNGQRTSWDSKSVIAKVTQQVIDRQIPWTAIFGNHDSEHTNDREQQLKYMSTLPYSLCQVGPKDVYGNGNCKPAVHALCALTSLLTLLYIPLLIQMLSNYTPRTHHRCTCLRSTFWIRALGYLLNSLGNGATMITSARPKSIGSSKPASP